MKMETPKMDVVRFEEADVLAASTYVYGFNDEVTKNAGVKYKGVDYKTSSQSFITDLQTVFAQDNIPSDVTFSSGHGSFTVTDMYQDDTMNISGIEQSIPLSDGSYIFSNGAFHKQ